MNAGLPEKQLKAARMIAMGIGYQEIADDLSVDRTTVFRWRKTPAFNAQVSEMIEAVTEESKDRVIRDVSEINDIVVNTLLDVAQNDTSGSARVSAARALSDLIQRAEDRFDGSDVMKDQSSEIRNMLKIIRDENLCG